MARLSAVDPDLGRAIVRLTERTVKPRAHTVRPAEIAAYGTHAVILVNPAKTLKRLPGVQLVPVGNGRALISLEHSNSIAQFELNVRDEVQRGEMNDIERQTLETIAEILQKARRSPGVTIEERTIIVFESKRQRPEIVKSAQRQFSTVRRKRRRAVAP